MSRMSDAKKHANSTEMEDLRTPPLYKERAFQYPYKDHDGRHLNTNGKPRSELKNSASLPLGTQSRLQSAAFKSYQLGTPINTLVTIRSCLFSNIINRLSTEYPHYEVVKLIIEKLRKWLKRDNRRLPHASMWTREIVANEGEHLHIALHLPTPYHQAFIEFLERLLGEPQAKQRRPKSRRTRGEIAVSQHEAWHIAVEKPDGKPEFPGYWLASYIGKGEFSERSFRGKLVQNKKKLERGQHFGGRLKHCRYDVQQGIIEGNHARTGRFGISRSLTP